MRLLGEGVEIAVGRQIGHALGDTFEIQPIGRGTIRALNGSN